MQAGDERWLDVVNQTIGGILNKKRCNTAGGGVYDCWRVGNGCNGPRCVNPPSCDCAGGSNPVPGLPTPAPGPQFTDVCDGGKFSCVLEGTICNNLRLCTESCTCPEKGTPTSKPAPPKRTTPKPATTKRTTPKPAPAPATASTPAFDSGLHGADDAAT